MGGRGRRTQRKHFRQNRENVWKRSKTDPQPIDENNQNNGNSGKDPTWIPWDNQSAAFDDYYREQGIVAPEEWDTFVDCLRKPLPAAFRINSSCQFCSDILQQVEDDFVKSLQAEISDGDEAEAIRPLPWYPEKLAWHSNFSRNQLRKNQTLQRFHGFLKQANEIGNITRQEAVSMVPPLFLNVHPDHFVLDMCAAPGSKTFQLLEIIHRSKEVGSLPSGMVVANDVDVQRSNLLIHQTKRMCTANLIVTNHEAQNFPGCQLKNQRNASDVGMANSISLDRLMFDRVLCDVPCSGDGTLRKAPDLWRKWNSGMANGLHSLQLKIAMRGLSLLRVGGRMVYSTCSMNPVENEAVVAEILRRCGESVELVDASSELPQLVRRPGMKKWKVRDKGGWLASYKDVPDNRRSAVTPSMFPSGGNLGLIEDDDDHESNEINSDSSNVGSGSVPQITNIDPVPSSQVACEEVSILPLEHCMRIVPHDQNTGAFFIAVFHKHSNIPVGPDRINGHDVDTQNKNSDLPEVALNEVTQSEITSDTNPVDDTKNQMSEPTPDADFVEEKPDMGAMGKQTSQVSAESNVDVFEDVAQKAGTKRKLQMQGRWKGVDPVLLFKDETIIDRIKKYYGIDDSFPFSGHLVSRNSDNNHVKRIYYISKSVKDVLDLNFQVGHPLKIASVGLKMFERQTSREGNSSPCSFRISSEGLPLLLPYITKQILYASPTDFKHLLQYRSIKFADFVDAEFGEKASNLMMGCCVVVLREADCDSAEPIRITSSTIAVGCWKGNHNLAVMASAIDCKDLLEWVMKRMGIEDVPMQESKPSATHEPIGTEDVGAMLDSEPSATHEPIGMEDATPVPDSEPSATHEPIGIEYAAPVPDNEPFSTPTVVDKNDTE